MDNDNHFILSKCFGLIRLMALGTFGRDKKGVVLVISGNSNLTKIVRSFILPPTDKIHYSLDTDTCCGAPLASFVMLGGLAKPCPVCLFMTLDIYPGCFPGVSFCIGRGPLIQPIKCTYVKATASQRCICAGTSVRLPTKWTNGINANNS